MKITNKYLIGMAAILGVISVVAVPAFAETNEPTGAIPGSVRTYNRSGMMGNRGSNGQAMGPGIFGTVTSVNGNTLTVSGRAPGMMGQSTTTFTVNATNATVIKNNATTTISSVLLGDMVSVRGTVTGTSVVATSIHDGLMMRGPGYVGPGVGKQPGDDRRLGTSTRPIGQNPLIKGNGQPVVAGTVATISGNTITITTSSNLTYTVDATNAVVAKGNATSTMSGSQILIGDYVVVQGTVAGQSVVASTVIDQPAHPTTGGGGIFGSIGQFFKHLFGF